MSKKNRFHSSSSDTRVSKKIKLSAEKKPAYMSSSSKISSDERSTLTAADALGLEHSISNLQNAIRYILANCPSSKELKKDIKHKKISQEALSIFERSPKIQLAADLKSLYNKGKLQIFDQIKEYDPNEKLTRKSSTLEHIGSAKKVFGDLKTRGSDDDGEEDDDNDDDGDEDEDTSSDSGVHSLPPLPKIKNSIIEQTVFTHKSVINKLTHLSKSDVLNSHNERYEFLGDSVLNNLVTMILFEKLKDATEGELTVIRAKIVSNHNLSEWSKSYGFPKRLRSEIDYGAEEAFSKGRTKIYADVFEAYVGGLISENPNNLSVIKKWLEALSRPLIDDLLKSEMQPRTDMVSIKNAKGELYALIGSALLSPKYVVTRDGDGSAEMYKVECKMGDETIGSGEGRSIKEAGSNAALDATNNREMIEKYVRLRMNTPRSISSVKPFDNGDNDDDDNDDDDDSRNNSQGNTGKLDEDPVVKFKSDYKISESDVVEVPVVVGPPENGDVDLDSRRKLNEIFDSNELKYTYAEVKPSIFEVTISVDGVELVKSSGLGKAIPSQTAAMFLLKNVDILTKKSSV